LRLAHRQQVDLCLAGAHVCPVFSRLGLVVRENQAQQPLPRQRPRKSAGFSSLAWIDLAVLAAGHSHYWFVEPSCDVNGWVFQATAHPEQPYQGEEVRVEVTELFINVGDISAGGQSRINITVTNCGGGWAPYSLWVAAIPPPRNLLASSARSRTALEAAFLPDRSAQRRSQLLAVHDGFGNIRSVAVPAGLRMHAGLRSQQGDSITQVQAADFSVDQLRHNPRAIAQNFRIDTSTSSLVRKS